MKAHIVAILISYCIFSQINVIKNWTCQGYHWLGKSLGKSNSGKMIMMDVC